MAPNPAEREGRTEVRGKREITYVEYVLGQEPKEKPAYPHYLNIPEMGWGILQLRDRKIVEKITPEPQPDQNRSFYRGSSGGVVSVYFFDPTLDGVNLKVWPEEEGFPTAEELFEFFSHNGVTVVK